MLQISVTHYDDVISAQGECVTMYMIQVQYSNRSAYIITKRYSDFANFYQMVKDIVPYDYKFPNKSMFNNSAQFTKDRRRKGFDELVKLLARYDPIPHELQTFIELHERVAGLNGDNPSKRSLSNPMQNKGGSASTGRPAYQSSIQRSTSTHPPDASKATITIKQQAEEIAARKKLVVLSNYLLRFSVMDDNEDEGEIDVYYEIKKIFSTLLRYAFRSAGIFYLSLIFLGFIDVSNCSYFRIVYTFIALVSLGCFVQIRDAKKSMIKCS